MGSNRARYPSKRTLARQGPPPGIYASTYDPLRGAAICRRLAAGESLRSICRADPDMPTEKTVWNWARAHPEFAHMRRHALDTARAASLAAQTAADEARRLARLTARRAPGRTGRPSGWREEVAEAILARLAEGWTLAQVCREPWAPSIGAIYYRLRRDPAFLDDYRVAKGAPCDMLVEMAVETSPWLGEEAASNRLLEQRVREASRRAARIATKRYAERQGPERVIVGLERPDGSVEVIYGADDVAVEA